MLPSGHYQLSKPGMLGDILYPAKTKGYFIADLQQFVIDDVVHKLQEEDLELLEAIPVEYEQELSVPTTELDQLDLSLTSALSPTEIKAAELQLKAIRNTMARQMKEASEKRELMQRELRDQMSLLHDKKLALEARLDLATEAIWSIGLYLGTGEQIVQVTKGQPAPKEQIITLRQSVLYMDEESAACLESGGLDITQLDLFDKWLQQDPSNINQLLPEPKGIVALKPRRTKKDYGDSDLFSSARLNDENLKTTFFLVRNGENVYRIHVDMVIGNSLFPTKAEYQSLFRDPFDKDNCYRPGDDRYMEAMKKSEKKQRHYLRVLLILQGLVDRTPILHPLAMDRINLCDPTHHDHFVRYIYDQENTLGDGRPSFSAWLKSVNAKLEVGMRVVARFGMYGFSDHIGIHDRGYAERRSWPANAGYPPCDEILTVEKKEGEDDYYIYFDRGEIWSSDKGYHDSQMRARYTIHKSDDFFVIVDAVTEEEIDYYLRSRLQRHNYLRMIPILRQAKELKRSEREAEIPFKELLYQKAREQYPIITNELIDEVTQWWKFKNRTHRALSVNEGAAYREILVECGLRLKRLAERTRGQATFDLVREKLVEPNTLLIAHKTKNKFVRYTPMNARNVWVCEETFRLLDGRVELIESKDWRLVDNRHKRWEILYTNDRWESWRINPPKNLVRTDPELQEMLELIRVKMETKHRKATDLWSYLSKADNVWLPLVAFAKDDFGIRYIVGLSRGNFRGDWYDRGSVDEPLFAEYEFTNPNRKDDDHHRHWDSIDKFRSRTDHIWRCEENFVKMDEFSREKHAIKERYEPWAEAIHQFSEELNNELKARERAELLQKHLDDGFDADLFQEPQLHEHAYPIRDAVAPLFEQVIPITGKTVGEVLEFAKENVVRYNHTTETRKLLEKIADHVIQSTMPEGPFPTGWKVEEEEYQ